MNAKGCGASGCTTAFYHFGEAPAALSAAFGEPGLQSHSALAFHSLIFITNYCGCMFQSIKLLTHNSAGDLRNRHAQCLQLCLVLAGGFSHSPLVVEPDDALAA